MEKKIWTKPVAAVEKFNPSEYIAACFYIACDYSGQTLNVNNHNDYHSPTGCGELENQAITVLSGDINSEAGATISITELNTRWGDLQCYFVGEEFATSPRETTISGVNAGETIYWVTNVGYWMPHKGTVTYSDANRPNHS